MSPPLYLSFLTPLHERIKVTRKSRPLAVNFLPRVTKHNVYLSIYENVGNFLSIFSGATVHKKMVNNQAKADAFMSSRSQSVRGLSQLRSKICPFLSVFSLGPQCTRIKLTQENFGQWSVPVSSSKTRSLQE